MKIRILDRILVAVAGVIIIALCAGVAAQVFFGMDVTGSIAKVLERDSDWVRIAVIAGSVIALLIGCYCFLVLFRHRSRRDKFIMQRMESGDLAISLKALETMVVKCVEQHKEIETQGIHLENQRDGLLIRIRGTVAGGISIPLTVDALQKQIKQYVTACSGVEVKGIRVQIESSGAEAKDAPFAIEAPTATPLLHGPEKKNESPAEIHEEEKTEQPEIPADTAAVNPIPVKSAAETAMEAAENLKKEYEETVEDDRPMHQRLFSTLEEPCIMPLPPEDLNREVSDSEADKPVQPAAEPEIRNETEGNASAEAAGNETSENPETPENAETNAKKKPEENATEVKENEEV